MIRRPPRSTPLYSSAASDVYKRQPAVPRPRPGVGRRTASAPPAPGGGLHRAGSVGTRTGFAARLRGTAPAPAAPRRPGGPAEPLAPRAVSYTHLRAHETKAN